MSNNPIDSLPPVTLGTCQTVGSGASHVITGRVNYAADPRDVAADQQKYFYHCYNPSAQTPQFEWCWGVWDEAGNSITRNPIVTSEPGNAPVDWPDNAVKFLAVALSPQFFQQYGLGLVDRSIGGATFSVGTSQSNDSVANLMAAPTLQLNPFLRDWSTAGVAPFSRANLAWRTPNPADQYADHEPLYVGYGRSVQVEGVWYQTCGTHYAMANALQIMHGGLHFMVHASAIGQGIENPGGWEYAPGSGNVAEVLSQEIANAIAALPAEYGDITYPHIILFNQGTTNHVLGTNSVKYGGILEQFMFDCSAPYRYGWAHPKNSAWVFVEQADQLRMNFPDFNGHAVAADFAGNNVRIVKNRNTRLVDGLHVPGEDNFDLGGEIARSVASTQFEPYPKSPAVILKKTYVDTADRNGIWTPEAPSGNPPAAGATNHSVAEDVLRVHKTDGNPFGVVDQSSAGYHRLGRGQPCTITMEQLAVPANYFRYTVEQMPEDRGDYWEWPVVAFEQSATAPTGFLIFKSNWKLWDGESATAFADTPFESTALRRTSTVEPIVVNGLIDVFAYSDVFADERGRLLRKKGPIGHFYDFQVVGSGVQTINGATFPEDSFVSVRYQIVAKNVTTNEIMEAEVRVKARRVGSANVVIDANTVDYVFPITDLAVSVTSGGGGFAGQLLLNADGKPGETWEFNILARYWDISDA